MSAPDTKALPPAPVITTVRTPSSLAKSLMIRLAASHISSETALCFAGLLKIMYPTLPSRRDSILSVWVISELSSASLRGARSATKQSPSTAGDCFGVLRTPRNDACVLRLPSNRIRLAQRRDLLGAVAELLEHLAGVLAKRGRGHDQLARRARQPHALADQGER